MKTPLEWLRVLPAGTRQADVREIQADARAELEAENKTLRDNLAIRQEQGADYMIKTDLKIVELDSENRRLADELVKICKVNSELGDATTLAIIKQQELEAENEAMRDRAEKSESACAEKDRYIAMMHDVLPCDEGAHVLSSDCGQSFLARLQAMEEILNDSNHDSWEWGSCDASCTRCRWEKLKKEMKQ